MPGERLFLKRPSDGFCKTCRYRRPSRNSKTQKRGSENVVTLVDRDVQRAAVRVSQTLGRGYRRHARRRTHRRRFALADTRRCRSVRANVIVFASGVWWRHLNIASVDRLLRGGAGARHRSRRGRQLGRALQPLGACLQGVARGTTHPIQACRAPRGALSKIKLSATGVHS